MKFSYIITCAVPLMFAFGLAIRPTAAEPKKPPLPSAPSQEWHDNMPLVNNPFRFDFDTGTDAGTRYFYDESDLQNMNNWRLTPGYNALAVMNSAYLSIRRSDGGETDLSYDDIADIAEYLRREAKKKDAWH